MRRPLSAGETSLLRELGEAQKLSPPSRTRQLVAFVSFLQTDGVLIGEILAALELPNEALQQLGASQPPKPHKRLIGKIAGELYRQSESTDPQFDHNGMEPLESTFLSLNQNQSGTGTTSEPELSNRGPSHAPDIVLLLGEAEDRPLVRVLDAVRDGLPHYQQQLVEHNATRLEHIIDQLDTHRPSILILAAHADGEGVHFSSDKGRLIVSWADIIGELGASNHKPTLLVLLVCNSAQAAKQFQDAGVRFVLSVVGEIDIECAYDHLKVLVRAMTSHDLVQAKKRADTRIGPSWPASELHLTEDGGAPWYAPWCLTAR